LPQSPPDEDVAEPLELLDLLLHRMESGDLLEERRVWAGPHDGREVGGRSGAGSRDFFGTAYGEACGKFEGFQFGEGDVSVNDTLLLIEPETAKQYATTQQKIVVVDPPEVVPPDDSDTDDRAITSRHEGEKQGRPGPTTPAKAKSFHGSAASGTCPSAPSWSFRGGAGAGAFPSSPA
jgi:hypothetical protein